MRTHRIKMEQRLGQPLKEDMVVHHIDGDRRNNDEDNLAIMTRKAHARLHARERKLGIFDQPIRFAPFLEFIRIYGLSENMGHNLVSEKRVKAVKLDDEYLMIDLASANQLFEKSSA